MLLLMLLCWLDAADWTIAPGYMPGCCIICQLESGEQPLLWFLAFWKSAAFLHTSCTSSGATSCTHIPYHFTHVLR